MAIRKQIKDYVFSAMNRFTQIFVNLKEDTFKKKTANLNNALENSKKCEFQLPPITRRNSNINSNINPNTNTITAVNPTQPYKNVLVANKATIFTTYNANSSTNNSTFQNNSANSTNINSQLKPPGVHKPYVPKNDFGELNKVDDNLTKPASNLFNFKLESLLGRKTGRFTNISHKPEFLNNQIPPVKYIPHIQNVVPNNTQRKDSSPYNSSIRIPHVKTSGTPLKNNKNRSRNQKKRTNKKQSLSKNSKFTAEKSVNKITKNNEKKLAELINLSTDSNENILQIIENSIILSKNILKFSEYYECIVINKTDIEEFFEDKHKSQLLNEQAEFEEKIHIEVASQLKNGENNTNDEMINIEKIIPQKDEQHSNINISPEPENQAVEIHIEKIY